VSRTILAVGSLLLLLAATGCGWSLFSPEEGRADCPEPAPLLGQKSAVPGYIVVFRDGTDAAETTRRLAREYGFTPKHVYEHALRGFAAEFSETALAGIRCEPEVRHVEHEGVIDIR
jgi:predicted transcriptional regulator